jgi:hypothetical protein
LQDYVQIIMNLLLPAFVCLAAGGSRATVDLVSPVVAAKAIKNEAEL